MAQLERQPGQKERRWRHLLSEETVEAPPLPEPDRQPAAAVVAAVPEPSPEPDAVAALEAEVARLRAQVERLYELLGETPE